jgi:hypothetical protein
MGFLLERGCDRPTLPPFVRTNQPNEQVNKKLHPYVLTIAGRGIDADTHPEPGRIAGQRLEV